MKTPSKFPCYFLLVMSDGGTKKEVNFKMPDMSLLEDEKLWEAFIGQAKRAFKGAYNYH